MWSGFANNIKFLASKFRESQSNGLHMVPITSPRTTLAVTLLCGLLAVTANLRADDWRQFGRDGTRNAVSPERRPPTDWNIGKPVEQNSGGRVRESSRNVKWSVPLGSNSFGDPVVVDGVIWVGTNNSGPNGNNKLDASVLTCFREADGKLLYRYVSPRLPQGRVLDWEYRSMSCSPLIDRDRLWFVTNRAEVVCLDIAPLHKGEGEPQPVWKADLIEKFGVFPRSPPMGFSRTCSIAAYKDFIYVVTGNGVDETYKKIPKPEAPSLICFHRDTGEAVWQDSSPGENILDGQWSSPTIVEIGGVAQCVAAQGDGWVRSFEALTGKPIWQFDMNRKEGRWMLERSTRNSILASPVFADNRIYIANGLGLEFGERPGRLVCLDPTRQGDISSELAVDRDGQAIPHRRVQAVDPAAGEKAVPNPNSGLVWEFTHLRDGKQFTAVMHASLCSVVVHQGLVIAGDSSGLVHCLDAKTGERYWFFDALAYINGSPLIVDDKVYVVDSDGDLMIFRLSPDPNIAMRITNGIAEPLREFNMGSWCCSSPVFANGVMYVATANELFAIAAGKPEPDDDLSGGYWPQWRGPNRDNVSSDKGLLQEWPEGGPPLLWTARGVGEGIASVSVAAGKAFTFGYQDQSEFVVALEEKTGELGWATRVGPAVAENPLMRWLSQRTATIDGERLYVLNGTGELVCLATESGREIWRKNYAADFGSKRPVWGQCDYPLVDGGWLICTPGGPDAKIVALDKQTGNVIWKTNVPGEPDERAAYAALIAIDVDGLRQYVTFLSNGLISVAADDGRFLWRYEGVGKNVTAHSHTPLARGDQIFCSNGYGGGLALLKVVRDGKNAAVAEIFKHPARTDAFQDCTVLVGDNLYTGLGEGFPACLSWQTGERTWQVRAEGQGKMALVAADGCLYLRHADGRMTLAQAIPEKYVQRGSFLISDHKHTAGATSPVVAGRRLYLRDDDQLLCYDIRADALASPPAPARSITLTVPAAAARNGAGATATTPADRRPAKGVFVPTPRDVVRQMLKLAQVKKSDVVCDLGSGDGRIVIAAAKDYGCKAIGYEIDPELVKLSREQVREGDVAQLVTIEMADVFDVDLSAVDVVTLYLLPQQIEKLVPQLKTMKPGSRIVSHQFAIALIKPDQTVEVESQDSGGKHALHFWTTPLKSGSP
jgi:outer membrane protein assembly factor BamB